MSDQKLNAEVSEQERETVGRMRLVDLGYEVPSTPPRTILKIIEDVRYDCHPDGNYNRDLSRRLREESTEAILRGMLKKDNTARKEWRELMVYFADDQRQLDRLCGQEPDFNDVWGLSCLVYVAGNAACGTDTATMTGTLRGLVTEMKDWFNAKE